MTNVAALRALCRAERNVRKLAPLEPFATVRCAYHTTPWADRSGAPEGAFSLDIRAYWADKPVLDAHWKPPVVARMQ